MQKDLAVIVFVSYTLGMETVSEQEMKQKSVSEILEILVDEYGDVVWDYCGWCGLENSLKEYLSGECSDSIEEIMEECQHTL